VQGALGMNCRGCHSGSMESFMDLGQMPLANSFPERSSTNPEPRYPLHAYVCRDCFLVQVPPIVDAAQLFDDYVYFSSYSDTWVEHARRFALAMISALGLTRSSQVLEIASNDGYLLRHFKDAGIPAVGVEPARNVAMIAEDRGIHTVQSYFTRKLAGELVGEGLQSDLVVANNVLAHVPDLHDFVAALAEVVKPSGTISVEVPHLLPLMRELQFDTIYHEHYSYFSLLALEPVFESHGLVVASVAEIGTHGGSLRLLLNRKSDRAHGASSDTQVRRGVEHVRGKELAAGLMDMAAYRGFSLRVTEYCAWLRHYLDRQNESGQLVAGYGAAAKGNVLLNALEATEEDVSFVADRNPYKQGRRIPGTGIPVVTPDEIGERRPNVILVFPWNLRHEITSQLSYTKAWGAKITIPMPRVAASDGAHARE